MIYLITNTINNKKYIGLTTEKEGFNGRYKLGKGEGIKRLFTHLQYYKKYGEYYNFHLYNSIEKYGFHNFDVNEVFDIAYSKEELINKEIYWIDYYKSNNFEKGYNITKGGEGGGDWSKNEHSLIKSRTSRAKSFNDKLDIWYEMRSKWENPFFNIWNYNDGLYIERKEVLFHMLTGGEIKLCTTCGIKIKKNGKVSCNRCS